MREKYESLPLATLKDLAKARGLKGISTMKKAELIERMLEEDEKEKIPIWPTSTWPLHSTFPHRKNTTSFSGCVSAT